MASRRSILHRLAAFNAFQPATLLWRVHEIDAIVRHVTLSGYLVDIGCGDGSLSGVVFDLFVPRPIAIGVEPDPSDAADARRSGAFARVHCTAGDRVPEPDGAFDVAFSNSTLEHITELGPVVAEMSRLVRPGGALVVTVPSEQFHECLGGSAIVSFLARRRGRPYLDAIDERLAHRRYLGPDEWRSLLAGHGFTNVRVHRYLPRAAVRAWERWSNATGGLAYELLSGRRSTRAIQRRSGLVRRVPALEKAIAGLLSRSRAIDAEIAPHEPSGGLLIVADRS